MCIFQSEQVIKLRFCHKKLTSLMFKSFTQLLFVDEKAKVNASYNVAKLLPNLIKDSRHLLSDNFIFQQDGAPAHTAALAQDWIKKICPGFIGKNKWPPNSPDLSPFDYHDSWHSSGKRLSCWRKSCAKFDSLFLNIQDATACYLKKWTLKFKLLYLLNHSCYFDKIYRICGICGLNSHL